MILAGLLGFTLASKLSHGQNVVQVLEHKWGDEVKSLGPAPDVITGADVMYEREHFPALLKTIQDLSAVHTITLLAFRLRGLLPSSPCTPGSSQGHAC